MENHAFSVTVEQLSSAEGLMYGKEEFTSDSCSHTCSRPNSAWLGDAQQEHTALPSCEWLKTALAILCVP